MTPSAFGQRIKQLEETLGHELFERTTRSVELTRHGATLLPHAKRVVREAVSCHTALAEGKLPPTQLILGTRFELGLSYVIPALLELPEHLAHLTLDVYFGSGDDILERLDHGHLDAIITSAPMARSNWSAEFLHREDYAFVAAPALIADTPFHTLDDARHHTMLDINHTLPLARYLTSVTERPLDFKEIRCFGAARAIQQMVVAGRGVAVLPEYMIADDLADGALVRLLPDTALLSDSFRLLYKHDALFTEAIASLAEYLRGRPLT